MKVQYSKTAIDEVVLDRMDISPQILEQVKLKTRNDPSAVYRKLNEQDLTRAVPNGNAPYGAKP